MFRRASKPVETVRDDNPLVAAVRPLNHATRRAMYAASNNGALRRHSWNGCAFNRAGEAVGLSVRGNVEAAQAFDLPSSAVTGFIRAWDQLKGSDDQCTALLRDALLTVGLFPETSPDGPETGSPQPGDAAALPRSYRDSARPIRSGWIQVEG